MAEAQEIKIKQLKCPICLETFSSPKVLPCMHIFCENCIYKHACNLHKDVTMMTAISCPICRSPVPAPLENEDLKGWATKLPNNTVVLSLSASHRADDDVPVYCEPCLTHEERHISVSFCVTCSEYLCNACYNCHKSFKMSRDHKITVLTEREYQPSNSLQDSMYICHIHKEKLTYYCSEHTKTCCIQCVIKSHRKCIQLSSADGLGENFTDSQDFKEAMKNLNVLRKMFMLLTKNRKTCLEAIEQQKSDVIKSIKDWSNLIKEQVTKRETTLLQKFEQICKRGNIIISDQIVECDSAIAAIDTSETMLMESTKTDDAGKIFVTLTNVSGQVLKYLQMYDRIENKSHEIVTEFHVNQSLKQIIQTPDLLGRVSSLTPRIAKLSPDYQFKGIFMTPLSIQWNATVIFDAKILYEDMCDITSGVYLPDKRIALLDNRHHRVKRFDKHFHIASYVDASPSSNFICLVDKETVAISACKKALTPFEPIVFLSVRNGLKTARKIEVGNQCYGIASYKETLTVCAGGDSILLFDASYKISKTIKLLDKNVLKPICLGPDGQRIHYTVQDQIVTIDMNGETLETFKSDELKDVVSVIVDKKGLIYCCGKESNNVVMFTEEGRKLCVLLSHEHGLKNPNGICLNDRNTKLLVFQRNSSKILVFTLV